MMRSVGLSLVAVASLAACTDTGAHLTLSAPDGPSSAKTFRVVLASPELVPSVRNQRLAPGDPSTTHVKYYLQRTIAGGESNEAIDDVDGFAVRIAPDVALAENSFIPFVLMYNNNGEIEGIGTYRAGEAPPSPIRIATDVIDKYVVKVERTHQLIDHSLELQPGEVRVITCGEGDQAYTSGVAWHTLAGEQYRLLFPDDGGLDATGRALDMDCDDHEVTAESSHRDCDDTRDKYYRDAEDSCDGEDTNCDGAQTIAKACDSPVVEDCQDQFSTSGLDGIELCNDSTQVSTTCHPTPVCGCNSAVGIGCHFCTMPFEGSVAMSSSQTIVHPCQPATGMLRTPGCTELRRCDVEIVGVAEGWKAKISAADANAFGSRAYDVGEYLAIRVERVDGVDDEIPGSGGQVVGDVHLAFTNSEATVYYGLELKLEQAKTECPIAPATAMLTCY